MILSCITTPVWGDARPSTSDPGCRVYGEHLSNCRGMEVTGNSFSVCSGCLPQPATHGLICDSCHERLEEALDVAPDLIPHMRSVGRGPADVVPVRTAPGPRMIVPRSWLTADDTWAALHEFAFRVHGDTFELEGRTTAYNFGSRDRIDEVHANVTHLVGVIHRAGEDAVGSAHTAALAVAFYRQVQAALAAYPLEERPRRLPYARCETSRGGCGFLTLERRPPLDYLDPVTVRCINTACGAVYDPAVVEVDLAAYRAQIEEEMA